MLKQGIKILRLFPLGVKMGDVNLSIGSGFFSLLTLLFIALKLLDKIDWSWWWVLSPLLIPFGVGLIIVLLIIIVYVISEVF